MADMATFFQTLLGCVADFLASQPIIYLVGCVLLLFIVKVFKTIIS